MDKWILVDHLGSVAVKTWPKMSQMGSLLVLVSPCFRENVVVTCKIGSLLCSSDNLLQKNVIAFFFFEIKFQIALI